MTTDEKSGIFTMISDFFITTTLFLIYNYITQQHWHDIAKMQSNKFLKNMQQTAILKKVRTQ